MPHISPRQASTATSTFGGGLIVGTDKLVLDSFNGDVGLSTTTPGYSSLSVASPTSPLPTSTFYGNGLNLSNGCNEATASASVPMQAASLPVRSQSPTEAPAQPPSAVSSSATAPAQSTPLPSAPALPSPAPPSPLTVPALPRSALLDSFNPAALRRSPPPPHPSTASRSVSTSWATQTTQTFTPTLHGTLGLGGGGTGLASYSGNQILYTNAAGTGFVQTSTSTLSIGGNAATATALQNAQLIRRRLLQRYGSYHHLRCLLNPPR